MTLYANSAVRFSMCLSRRRPADFIIPAPRHISSNSEESRKLDDIIQHRVTETNDEIHRISLPLLFWEKKSKKMSKTFSNHFKIKFKSFQKPFQIIFKNLFKSFSKSNSDHFKSLFKSFQKPFQIIFKIKFRSFQKPFQIISKTFSNHFKTFQNQI